MFRPRSLWAHIDVLGIFKVIENRFKACKYERDLYCQALKIYDPLLECLDIAKTNRFT